MRFQRSSCRTEPPGIGLAGFIRARLIYYCWDRCVDCDLHYFPLPKRTELCQHVSSPCEEIFAIEFGKRAECVTGAMRVVARASGAVGVVWGFGGFGGFDIVWRLQRLSECGS